MRLVLASASEARALLLRNAGVDLLVDPADLDENALKAGFFAKGLDAAAIAERLAEAKANSISSRHQGLLVLGADQVLVHLGEMLDKPLSRAEAAAHLQRLRNSGHELLSAAAIILDGQTLWRRTGRASLQMRDISDHFIEGYLDQIGDKALESVGAYQLEGIGAQLFERVEGDYFTILGLPLLEVLSFLRQRGVLPE